MCRSAGCAPPRPDRHVQARPGNLGPPVNPSLTTKVGGAPLLAMGIMTGVRHSMFTACVCHARPPPCLACLLKTAFLPFALASRWWSGTTWQHWKRRWPLATWRACWREPGMAARSCQMRCSGKGDFLLLAGLLAGFSTKRRASRRSLNVLLAIS